LIPFIVIVVFIQLSNLVL